MASEPIYENADFSPADEDSRENSHAAQPQFVEEQIDWLTVDHDDLRQELEEQLARPKYVPAMSVIDRWEKEMIGRIRQTAVLARRKLVNALDQHVLEVKKSMDMLTPILRDARAGVRPFNEETLREWHAQLQELKKAPDYSVIVDKREDIHRLIVDLRDKQPIQHVYLPSEKSQLPALISIVHQLLPISVTNEEDQRSSSLRENHASRNLVTFREPKRPASAVPRKPRCHIRFETHSNDSPSHR